VGQDTNIFAGRTTRSTVSNQSMAKGKAMPHIPMITDEEAGPEAEILFKHSTQMFGRVANAVRTAAHSPKLAQSIYGFIVAALREEVTGILDVRTKALVILKTSMLNGCRY
jgi:hypothetical protein